MTAALSSSSAVKHFLPSLNIITESHSIRDLLGHRDQGTWFVFDIDNVLMKTPDQIGSDQWFRWRCAHVEERKGDSFEKALNQWTALQLLTDLKPVEEKTVEVVRQLQQEHFPTFAITSRGIRLGDRTVQQINSCGISFDDNRKEIFWPRGLTEKNQEHVLYERGILFTAGQNKGIGLEKYLEEIQSAPSQIVYIDDSKSHVQNVAETCRRLGIGFIGYHYRYLDSWVAEFNQKEAKAHLNTLESIAS